MVNSSDSGCGCILIVIGIVVLVAIIRQLPAFFSWYGKVLAGPYGGIWGIPLFLLIIVALYYFTGKDK